MTQLHGAALAAHEARLQREQEQARDWQAMQDWRNCDGAGPYVAPRGFRRVMRGDYFTIEPIQEKHERNTNTAAID